MSRFCKFGKLHVTKGNVDKLLGILLTAAKQDKKLSILSEAHSKAKHLSQSGEPP